MDQNKLEVLRSIGYTIPGTCGLCKHGVFPQNEWGTCSVQEYQHKKHTGDPRKLSIVKSGSCSLFEKDETKIAVLGAFKEFVK